MEKTVEQWINEIESEVGKSETKWVSDWRKREYSKTDNQRNLDQSFYQAISDQFWTEAERLWNEGATGDYIYYERYDGWTAYWKARMYNSEWADRIQGMLPINLGPVFFITIFYC